MPKTTIEQLAEFGQSVWLDNISRSLIEGGKLKQMVGLGLRGVTSNPTIFDKAIGQSSDYDEKIISLSQKGKSTFDIYDELTVADVQDAADIFRPVYEQTKGLDGYVSLEINPQLAHLSKETIAEGRRLHQKVNRQNVMLKVPATDEGFLAMEELLAGGISINATLIFSVEQYVKTAAAYLKGIKRLLEKRGEPQKVCSVASVFVSRIDTAVDKMIDVQAKKEFFSLKGKAAAANAGLIFKKYLEVSSCREFLTLKENGARIQRLLWGSTSTKNPAYSDIKYVCELIGKNTINTMPESTFEAFLGHGAVQEALSEDIAEANDALNKLKNVGIDVGVVCEKLLQEGVRAFEESFDSLLKSIEGKAKSSILPLTK